MNLDLHVKYRLFLSDFKQQQPSNENFTQLSDLTVMWLFKTQK